MSTGMSFSEQLSASIRNADRISLHDLFGRDQEDTANLAELFGLPIPGAEDSVSSQRLLEQLQTEATLLRQSLASSAIPSLAENKTMNRIMSAVAFVRELQTSGTSGIGLRSKGFGDRRAIDAISQESIDYAVGLLMQLEGQISPPAVAHSVQAQAASVTAPSRVQQVVATFESRVKSLQTQQRPNLSPGQSLRSAHSLDSAIRADLQLAIANSLEVQPTVQRIAGAGVGSFTPTVKQASTPSERSSGKAASDVAAQIKLAKLHAEQLELRQQQLKAEAEILRLEQLQASQSGSSRSADFRSENEPQTPPRKPDCKGENPFAQSPNPDETHASMLRAQLEEVEARLKASAAVAADPQLVLQRKINELALENELLRKAHLAIAVPPAPELSPVEVVKQAVTQVKEAETCKVPSAMPTDKNYRLFRDSLEVSIVSGSGRPDDATTFVAEIDSSASPLSLALSCPEKLKSWDAKIACSLHMILSGNVGSRINLAIKRDPRLKFSGRAIIKLLDEEFHHLSATSVAIASSKLHRLRMRSKDFAGLELYLNQWEEYLILLKGTDEEPTNSTLANLIEEHVEPQVKDFLGAEFALHRQAYPVTINAEVLIELLKARCKSQRALSVRTDANRVAALVTRSNADDRNKASAAQPAEDKGKKGESVPTVPAQEACRKFLAGTCTNGDKCKYAHASKAKGKPQQSKGKSKGKQKEGDRSKSHLLPDGTVKPCVYFPKGKCTKGDACLYSHAAVKLGAVCLLASMLPEASSAFVAAAACMCVGSNLTDSNIIPALVNQTFVQGNGSVLDSGSGLHLSNKQSVDAGALFKDNPVILDAAQGLASNSTGTHLPADDILPARSARVLDKTPNVTSLGQLCMRAGFSFFWLAFHEPVLITKSGICYKVPLQHLVPVLEKLETVSEEDGISLLRQLEQHVSTTCAAVSSVVQPMHIIEYACYDDSLIGRYAPELNITPHRYSLSFADLSTNEGIQRAVAHTSTLSGHVNLFGAVPCSPWTPIQHLCEAVAKNSGSIKAYKYKLKRDRQRCLKMLSGLSSVAEVVAAKHGTITSEQTESSELLREDAYIAFERKFNLTRISINQCMYGLECPKTGLPLKKGHVISTNCPQLIQAFSVPEARCPGKSLHAIHGEVIGGNSAFTGRYTPHLVRVILRALASHAYVHALVADSESAHAEVVSDPAQAVDAVAVPSVDAEEELTVEEEESTDKWEILCAEAVSTQHMLAHLPFNAACKFCNQAKQKRAQHRRLLVDRVRAPAFALKMRGDNIFADDSIEGNTTALIIVDDCTDFCQAYPSQSKDSAACEKAIRHFAGPSLQAACVFHSDKAPELLSACNAIGISHDPAVPYVPQTRSLEERRNQTVMQAARTSLLHSGLPVSYWDYAVSHAATAISISRVGSDKLTPWQRKHNSVFPGLLIPFGACVTVVPTHKSHKFSPAGEQALFLQYDLAPGMKFSTYSVMLLSDYIAGKHHVFKTRDIKIPASEWHFPLKSLQDEAIKNKYVSEQLLKNQGIGVLLFAEADKSDPTETPTEEQAPAEPAQADEFVQPVAPPPAADAEETGGINTWAPRKNSSRPPHIHPNFWRMYGPAQRQAEALRYQESLKAIQQQEAQPPQVEGGNSSAPYPLFQEGGSSSSSAGPAAAVAKLLSSVADLLHQASIPAMPSTIASSQHRPSVRKSFEQLGDEVPDVPFGPVYLPPLEEEQHRAPMQRVFSLVTRQIRSGILSGIPHQDSRP